MSLVKTDPGTMLGLAAEENRRTHVPNDDQPTSPKRSRPKQVARWLLTLFALVIGLSSFSLSSAQAWPWDDMKDNITATIVNMCGPNNLSQPTTYTNIDTLAGLNTEASDGMRATIKPNFSYDEGGTQGGNGTERLNRVYADHLDVVAKPTYERYGFSALRWSQYGYDCFSPTLMMGPAANMALMALVHVPMIIAMAFLNFVMDNALYTAFATLMQPFIGAMYEIFNPWIYFLVPIGVAVAWLTSKGSATATLKAAGWGLFILAIFLLMGASTSQVVTWATNIVTEVSGTAACKMNAAATGDDTSSNDCDADDPVKAVNQALWYGVPYQTWHIGQVGEQQAAIDRGQEAEGRMGWGAALLNGQYVGVDESGNVDDTGRRVVAETEAWNRANYSPDSDSGKVARWTEHSAWNEVPFLANVKIMCNDVGGTDNDEREPSDKTRWMYSGNDGDNTYCDTAGAGTTSMISYFKGDEYNEQFVVALSGMVGVSAVAVTILGAATYLGFQKMFFFFLLFLGPIVLTVSALGDRKRRPFAVRYAELLGANLLKQVAAVCIVLFVSYAMSSLFGSNTFGSVPWIMKPYVALLFFIALLFLAFPIKNIVKGAVRGDTSALDKEATRPQRTMKTTAKVAGVAAATVATAGVGAALGAGAGAGALAGTGGKAAAMGKAGTMLGQAGRVMGIGSRSGRAMRAGGQLLKAGQGIMNSKDTTAGRKAALGKAAETLLNSPDQGAKYRDQNGKLLPNAQQMAMKDAQKIAEQGQKTDRATKAQDATMAAFFNGYKAQTGQFHKDDPNSPDNKKQAQIAAMEERRQIKSETDRANATASAGGANGTDASKPVGATASAGGGNGAEAPKVSGPDGQSGPGGSGGSGRQVYQATRAEYQEKARENLSGPAFAREMEYSTNTVRPAEDVLSNAGLSKDQVLQNPTLLLSGEAYNGGSTTAMDPFHPATGALNELRFASSSGDEQAIESAVSKAVDTISYFGVPDQVSDVHSIGPRAEKFESIQLVGAMPTINENTTWQERAEAAQTMMAAQVAMPENYPAREAVQEYTSALANPAVDPNTLSSMQEAALEAIGSSMTNSMSDAGSSAAVSALAGGMAGAAVAGSGEVVDREPVADSGAASGTYEGEKPSVAPESVAPANATSREDLRDAVHDGLRDARLERDAADVDYPQHGQYSAPPETPSHVPSVEAPPASTPNPGGDSQSVSYSAPEPASVDEPVEAADDDEPLVFRPRRRRARRSGFFGNVDDWTDEEGDE